MTQKSNKSILTRVRRLNNSKKYKLINEIYKLCVPKEWCILLNTSYKSRNGGRKLAFQPRYKEKESEIFKEENIMKKVAAIILSLVMSLGLASCATTTNTTTATTATTATTTATTTTATAATTEKVTSTSGETTATGKALKVAGVVFQEDQFMKLVQLGYAAAAKDNGVECNLANTNGDTTKELELINTYVAQNYDGIAICPINETTSIEALRKADVDGVKIAISNLTLTDVSFIYGGYTSNQYDLCAESGKIAAAFIKATYPEGSTIKIGRLGAMSVLPDITRDRWAGFLDQLTALKGYTIDVVAEQDAWLQDDAIAAVDDMLTANPDINIFYGFNEGSAIGATMAVKNAGLKDVYVFGIDANEQLCNMLESDDNILQGTTSQDPYMMGYLTMEALIKGLRGEDISAVKGKVLTTSYIPLARGDNAKIDAFLKDLKEKMG